MWEICRVSKYKYPTLEEAKTIVLGSNIPLMIGHFVKDSITIDENRTLFCNSESSDEEL
jgi:hypothetical protein